MTSLGKVAVIDDSKTILVLTEKLLRDEGYEVFTMTSAVGAVAQLRRFQPDLLLLDLSMPELDGEALLHIVNDLNVLPDLVVLLYSDQDSETLREVATRSGAQGYIRKGDPFRFLEQVESWMAHRWFSELR